jgi:transposase
VNRPGHELPPKSWTNFKGFHKTVQNGFQAQCRPELLARRWSVSEERIRTWASHYRLQGVDGLSTTRSAYSSEFRMQVPYHQDREQLSSRKVAAIYDIRNSNQIVVWRRIPNQDGIEVSESTWV